MGPRRTQVWGQWLCAALLNGCSLGSLVIFQSDTKANEQNVSEISDGAPYEQHFPVQVTSRDSGLLAEIRDDANTAKGLMANGQRREARRWLRSLLNRAQEIHDRHLHDEAIGKVALAQAEFGDFDGARQTAEHLLDGTLKGEAFMLIDSRQNGMAIDPTRSAFFQAKVGNIQGALETTAVIEDALSRSYVLESIVKQQVAAGDMLGALQLAHAISDLSIRTTTLSIIAWGQTKGDDIEGALKTLDGIDDVSRDSLLVNLVESRARHHNLRGARQLAAAIHDSGKHLSAERYIEAYSFSP